MAALEWDIVGERIYQTGVDRGVLYVEMGAGVSWNGLTSVEEQPTMERKTSYLDGVKYLEHIVPNDYSGKLKAFTYPDEFERVLGNVPHGAGMIVHDQPPTTFGLSYRTRIGNDVDGTEHGYKIHLLYNLTAVPDESVYDTMNNQVSPVEFGWDLSGTPESIPGYRPTSHLSIDSTKISPEALEELEDILYGTDDTDPMLPTWDEVIVIVGPGDHQSFEFTPGSVPSGPGDNPLLVVPLTVPSFGDETIGYLKLSVYLTIPDLADLSLQLVHPAWSPNPYGRGMVGYHVVNYIYEGDESVGANLGISELQPVVFVWDTVAPSVTGYAAGQSGEFNVADDFSTLYGLPMAGEWELWVYDKMGPRDGVDLWYAELEIFDGNSIAPAEPSTPTPSLNVTADGLELTLNSSGTTGGVGPLRYHWEIFDNNDTLVGAANSGFPSSISTATFTVPTNGLYYVTVRVTSDTNHAKAYLVDSVVVG